MPPVIKSSGARVFGEQAHKRFFVPDKNDPSGKKKIPVSFHVGLVTIKTRWNDVVVFRKSSRGGYKDSRSPKESFSAGEIEAEILRLTGEKDTTAKAMAVLTV
jgi:hypothetical protein